MHAIESTPSSSMCVFYTIMYIQRKPSNCSRLNTVFVKLYRDMVKLKGVRSVLFIKKPSSNTVVQLACVVKIHIKIS